MLFDGECHSIFQGDNGVLLAYQIAFDLYENASQQFINKIEKALLGEDPTKHRASGDGDASTSEEKFDIFFLF